MQFDWKHFCDCRGMRIFIA